MDEARYDHLDELGHSHNFREFGMSMKALGYHPLYVLGRLVANTFNSDIGFKGSWTMLMNYISYRPSRSDPYYSVLDDELKHAIRERQKKNKINIAKTAIINNNSRKSQDRTNISKKLRILNCIHKYYPEPAVYTQYFPLHDNCLNLYSVRNNFHLLILA